MMQSTPAKVNFHARTALAASLGPSYPEVPLRDPDASSSSEDESEEEIELEPFQQTAYQREKTLRMVPEAPKLRGGVGAPGYLAPPLKMDAIRPPGGCLPPKDPPPRPPSRHYAEKPRSVSDLDPARCAGLGPLFSQLSDSLVAKLCTHIDRSTLLSLTQCSRILYQLANWDSRVWKTHALRRWCGDFTFRTSWKMTAFYSHKGNDLPNPRLVALVKTQFSNPPPPPPEETPSYAQQAASINPLEVDPSNPYAALQVHFAATKSDKSSPPHSPSSSHSSQSDSTDTTSNASVGISAANATPKNQSTSTSTKQGSSTDDEEFIRIPGFYSESMYKEWYLSQVDLDGWYHDTGHVPRIRASEVTLEQFRERFLKAGQPCIITDVVPTWPAFRTWHPDTLMEPYCETLIKVNEYNDDNLRIKMTMRDFLVYMRENEEYKPLYVFDSSFQRRAPQMLNDYGIPQYFWEDLFAALDDSHRPAYRWWLMGSARTGSPFHQDPNGTSAWNAVTHGHKRWALYPPWMSVPPGAYANGHNPNSLKWWTLIYPQLPPHEKPIEFIQNPGDLIFIPSGWWHAVLNLDETVSVTQNFVNLENLDAVVHSLVSSDMRETVEYWRARLLPLRPELYRYIGDRVVHEASLVNSERVNELEQQLEEQQEAFEEREKELTDEIAQLKAQLESLAPSSTGSSSSKAVPSGTSAASFTARLIAEQKRKKTSRPGGGY